MPTATNKRKSAAEPSKTTKTRKPTKAEVAQASELRHIEFLKADIGRKFTSWRKSNPTATLGELFQFLEDAQDELLSFNGDDLLVEIESELCAAADYLDTWEKKTGYMDNEEPATVDYRLENMEEDIGEVEELIEALGETFSVKRLPKWKPRSQTA